MVVPFRLQLERVSNAENLFDERKCEGHSYQNASQTAKYTEDDRLQPDQQRLENARRESREYWQTLVARAVSQYRNGIPPVFAKPRNMLGRVPTIRSNLRQPYSCRFRTPSTQDFRVQASPTWVMVDGCSCELEGQMKIVPTLLQLSIQEQLVVLSKTVLVSGPAQRIKSGR